MTVTNMSKKIINIGTLALLPEKTEQIPADYEGNPIVEFFIKRGDLRLATGPAPAGMDEMQAASVPAAETKNVKRGKNAVSGDKEG